MKKYIITESQLKSIVEKYEPVPPNVAKAPPMSFDEFMDAMQKDNVINQTDSDNKGDLKSYVAAKMGASRAEKNIGDANDSLNKIAANTSKSMDMIQVHKFRDDNVLAKTEDLSVIVLSLLYYFYKEGQIDHNVRNNKDVSIDYNTVYNGIKKHGVDDFKWLTNVKFFANWFIWTNEDDETESIISSEGETVQVHIDNETKKTKLVRLSNISSKTLTKFYSDVLRSNNPNFMQLISKAIKSNIVAKIDSGSLEFIFR